MSKNIISDGKSISDLLTDSSIEKFVIPEFQRKYVWTSKNAQELFDDIHNSFSLQFSEEIKKFLEPNKTSSDGFTRHIKDSLKNFDGYFIGAIIYYGESHDRYLIDGQQRFTTINLLLKAILEHITDTRLKVNITDCITVEDNIPKLESRAIFDEEAIVLNKIISSTDKEFIPAKEDKGSIIENNLYYENYRLFVDSIKDIIDELTTKYEDLYKVGVTQEELKELYFNMLGKYIIDKVVMIPIGARDLDSSLIIFQTINNRGIALTKSDIYKSQIYNRIKNDEAECKYFIDEWNKLEKELDALNCDFSMQDLFSLYLSYCKGQHDIKDDNTKSVEERLLRTNPPTWINSKASHIIDIFKVLLVPLKVAFNKDSGLDTDSREDWEIRTFTSKKMLDILSCFDAKGWMHSVCTFYARYHYDSVAHKIIVLKDNNEMKNFRVGFERLLKKIICMQFGIALTDVTVSRLKSQTNLLNSRLFREDNFKDANYEFTFAEKGASSNAKKYNLFSLEVMRNNIQIPNKIKSLTSPLLYLLAYVNNGQDGLLPVGKLEIEHIKPQASFKYNEDPQQKDLCNNLGNLTLLEKEYNASAGNNKFSDKKVIFEKSSISMNQDLLKETEFEDQQIKKRTEELSDLFIKTLSEWSPEIFQK
ncbi:hypothetical protein CKF54_07245 [Psittacicella hinzii]|uniref:DUF262 domain-containing protein n=1 Tax=Psittacicella hinzii TaxID=2028575 RepID=A0A3A1Y155_9GAMM|nr:DUF262 domain-containing protein [Psittacicella hinzii]RIY31191.1 hypothetical protein CKF54_07245 [Psittacicella hinzii]